MSGLEERGEMKSWLRMSVLVGDLLVWVSAVVVFCRRNYRKGDGRKGGRSAVSFFFCCCCCARFCEGGIESEGNGWKEAD